MIGKVCKTGGGGNAGGLNVFAQATEPATKDGIWINTSATGSLPEISKLDYKAVEILPEALYDAHYVYTKLRAIPYSFMAGGITRVGEEIFIFGGDSERHMAYKYNPETDEYTRLTDIPYEFRRGAVASIGTDIFLFGGYASQRLAYKYDSFLDTYTRLSDVPYDFFHGAAVTIGNDIFIMGADYNTAGVKYMYKYSPSSNSYTKLSDMPKGFTRSVAIAVDTCIFLWSDWEAYKYDSQTDTYTQLAYHPASFHLGGGAFNGQKIYLFNTETAWEYNPLDDTYISVEPLPYSLSMGGVQNIGDLIFILGGSEGETDCYKMSRVKFVSDYVYLFNGTGNQAVELSFKLIAKIQHAGIGTATGLGKYPAYYGDGIQWNLLPS